MNFTYCSDACTSHFRRYWNLWLQKTELWREPVRACCPIFSTRHSLWSEIRGRGVKQTITVISLSCRRLPSVCSSLSLVEKEHPLFSSSPICQDHSFRLVSFWVGAGVCLWRGMITAKKTDEKAKCRWSLISFEESHLLLLFVTPLSHDPISLFVQGLPAVPLTSHFSSLIPPLSSSPFYSSLSPLCLIWFPTPNIPFFIIFFSLLSAADSFLMSGRRITDPM